MLTLNHLLLAIGAATGRVGVVYVSPVRRCSWCKGTLRAKKHRYWGRVGACPKCKATGKHYRFGAITVHRWRRALLADLKERRSK